MVQFLRIKERWNATPTALADNGDLLGWGNTGGIVAGRPRSDLQERTCFFCSKAGHMIKDCKRMQKAKELERRDRASRRRSPDTSCRQPQGNAKVPTQRAAQ